MMMLITIYILIKEKNARPLDTLHKELRIRKSADKNETESYLHIAMPEFFKYHM